MSLLSYFPETDKKSVKDLCARIKSKCNQYKKTYDFPETLSISLGFETREKRENNLNYVFNKSTKKCMRTKNSLYKILKKISSRGIIEFTKKLYKKEGITNKIYNIRNKSNNKEIYLI